MKLLYKEEHLACLNYDMGSRPAIEVKEIEKDHPFNGLSQQCKIVFLLEGNLRYTCGFSMQARGEIGNMLFIPPEKQFALSTKENAKILIMRLPQALRFCENYLIDTLLSQTQDTVIQSKGGQKMYLLPINKAVEAYIGGLQLCVERGLRCKYYFEVKTKELFYLFRAFYIKEELAMFFREILNTNSYFFYFVKHNYRNYKTASEFADGMNMTLQRFEKCFKAVFHMPAYQWMIEQKVNEIHYAVCTEDTPFKELAERFGFSSKSSFSDFYKRNMGVTPGHVRKKMLTNKNDEQKEQNT